MTESTGATMEMPPPPNVADRLRQALPRRRFFSDMPDKGLFGASAGLGFITIYMMKVADWNADYVAVLAVLLMLSYGVLAYRMPAMQTRLDRLGDNFYYLGFILTLASLSAALFQLRGGTHLEELLGSFGIALVTTIFGIAGRIMFVQLRGEIDDIEDQVRRDLAATSADLRAQLSSSVRDFETFRTGLLQTLNETAEEFAVARRQREQQVEIHAGEASKRLAGATSDLHSHLGTALQEFEKFRGHLTEASKRQAEQIEALAAHSAERLDAVFDETNSHAKQMAKLVHTIAEGVDQTVRRLETMELPGQQLNTQFEKFAKELEDMLDRLSAVVNVATRSAPRRNWPWLWRC